MSKAVMPNQQKTVAVALSGGVDSSVVAALLKKQGYKVIGFHMRLWTEPEIEGHLCLPRQNRCCSTEALEDARAVAATLEIPFYVVNYEQEFKKEVVDYFLEEYAGCRTPNPCIVCNRRIKFGTLLSQAVKIGADYLATGHYVRVTSLKNSFKLLKGVDKNKDQAYMLWTLRQGQLSYLVFPLGERFKSDVRQLAKDLKLPVFEKVESQEICFISGKDYRDFLHRQIPTKIIPGEVVNTAGQVIGTHQGLPLYTIGQRKGFNVQSNVPMYVVGYKPEKNQLVVGRGEESEVKTFEVEGVNWISGKSPKFPLNCQVQVRYQGEISEAAVCEWGNGLEVILNDSSRQVTPGQSVVFYQGEEVLGGGIILRSVNMM